jgi:hypothetical protein
MANQFTLEFNRIRIARAATHQQRIERWIARYATIICAISLVGCNSRPAPAPDKPKETTKVTTLIISKTADGVEVPVGKLIFENGQEPQLVPEGPARDTEALRKVWQEIKQSDELPMPTTVKKEVNGQKVTEFNQKLISKGDKLYPSAVRSALEEQHHYTVERRD